MNMITKISAAHALELLKLKWHGKVKHNKHDCKRPVAANISQAVGQNRSNEKGNRKVA